MGYYRAGFDIVGVDIQPQPHYPFEFHQADALTYTLDGFDAYHASPPCQPWTKFRSLVLAYGVAREYPELVEPTRERLIKTGKPYVLENVPGAPLINPYMLCGSSFFLKVRRHRLFETNFPMFMLKCAHHREIKDKPPTYTNRLRKFRKSGVVGVYGKGRCKGDTVALWREAMGIDWMTRREMAEAIPPAFTEYIGQYLLAEVLSRATNPLKRGGQNGPGFTPENTSMAGV